MAASGLHISISAEPIAHIGGLTISNSMFTSLIASAILILLALIVNRSLKSTNRPGGIQNVFEFLIESLYNLVHGITEHREKTQKFFPLIATFFLFILVNNWLGLVPGVGSIGFTEYPEHEEDIITTTNEFPVTQLHEPTPAAENVPIDDTHALPTTTSEDVTVSHGEIEVTPVEAQLEIPDDSHTAEAEAHDGVFVPYLRAGTADLNTTLALALITMFSVQIFGVTYLKLGYFSKFINFSNPIMFFVGILEIISEFGKIISFAFRLFGNIFAGEVLLAVITFLVPIIAPMPFYGLEIFVGMIQALVFALLSTVLYNVATLGHEEH